MESDTRNGARERATILVLNAADALYAASCGLYTTLPRDNNARLLVTVAADQLIALRENQSKLEARC